MSKGKWINKGRKCPECASGDVIYRGIGVRNLKHYVAGVVLMVRRDCQRLKCKSCGKSWSQLHKDESKYSKITTTLEAHLLMRYTAVPTAQLSRELGMDVKVINRIYNDAMESVTA